MNNKKILESLVNSYTLTKEVNKKRIDNLLTDIKNSCFGDIINENPIIFYILGLYIQITFFYVKIDNYEDEIKYINQKTNDNLFDKDKIKVKLELLEKTPDNKYIKKDEVCKSIDCEKDYLNNEFFISLEKFINKIEEYPIII